MEKSVASLLNLERVVISNWARRPQGRDMQQVVYKEKVGKTGELKSVTKHEVKKVQ